MKDTTRKNGVKIATPDHVDGVLTRETNLFRDHTAPRHVHHTYVFSLAIQGSWSMDCGHCGEKQILHSGDVLLTEPHEVYGGRTIGRAPWFNLSVSISKEKLASLLDLALDGKKFSLPHYRAGAVRNPLLSRLFLALYDSLVNNLTPFAQESLLLDWIAEVGKHYSETPNELGTRRVYAESGAVRTVREYIHANVGENIKLDRLAEIGRLSPFHLNRIFASQVGVPPHEFQNHLRVEKAQRMIDQNKSFSEIASEIGFCDQSHFNRFFKRYVGVTPKEFSAR